MKNKFNIENSKEEITELFNNIYRLGGRRLLENFRHKLIYEIKKKEKENKNNIFSMYDERNKPQ